MTCYRQLLERAEVFGGEKEATILENLVFDQQIQRQQQFLAAKKRKKK
jgi:hypothetical protein